MEETALFPMGPSKSPAGDNLELIFPPRSRRYLHRFGAAIVRVWLHLQFVVVMAAAYLFSVLPQLFAIADVVMATALLSFAERHPIQKSLLCVVRAIAVFIAGLFLYELRPARRITTWIAVAICIFSIAILSVSAVGSVMSAAGITVSVLEIISLGIIGRRKITVPGSLQYQSLST